MQVCGVGLAEEILIGFSSMPATRHEQRGQQSQQWALFGLVFGNSKRCILSHQSVTS